MSSRRLRQPLDLIVVAGSLSSLGIPANIDLDTVRRDLAGWAPRTVMEALAIVLHNVREAGGEPDEHRRFLAHLAPAVREKAERWLDESDDQRRQVLLSEQFVAIAGLIALEQSSPSGDDDRGELVSRLIAGSLAVADLVGVEDLLLDISRMVLFAESQAWSDELTVARAIVRLLCKPSRKIDYDALCRSGFGVGFEEAWMMTAVFAVIGRHHGSDSGLYPWKFSGEEGGLDDATLAAGRRLWLQTLSEAVERATQDTAKLGWSFRAFVERPITESGDEHIVVWPRAFEEKAFPFGVFALAQRVAGAAGIPMDQVREDCSDVLEELISEQLASGYSHLREIITEDEQRTRFTGKPFRTQQADFLLVEDRYVVALEVRHRPYSYKAQAVGDLGDLERDIELSIVNKIEQCDAALENAERSGLLDGRTPIAVVLNSCPVPVSPLLMMHIERRLTERNITPFRDRHPYTIAVVTAVHLHQIIRGARRTDRSVGGLVERWRKHPSLGEIPFYDWATQHCRRATRDVEADWLDDAVRTVLGIEIGDI